MNRPTGIFIAMIVCALLAVAVFFLADMGSEKVFASPEEVFEASRIALKKNDMRAWCQCLTDDSRDFMAANIVIQEFASKQKFSKIGADDKKEQIRAVDLVFAQHGLTDEGLAQLSKEAIVLRHPKAPPEEKLRFAQEVLKPVRDRNGLIAELFKAILKGANADNPFDKMKDAQLKDVEIKGRTAVGIVFYRNEDQEPLPFRKQGEGWRIDLFPEDQQRPGLPPGHP